MTRSLAQGRALASFASVISIVSVGLAVSAFAGCGGVAISEPAASADAATSQADGSVGTGTDGGYVTPKDAGACWLDRPTALRQMPPELPAPRSAGIRLTFRLEDHKLVPVRSVDQGVSPAWTSKGTQLFEEGKTSGFWVELRGKDGTILYQRNYFDPLGTRLEAPGAPPAPPPPDSGFQDPAPSDGGWMNIPVCPKDGTEFFVEVPNDPAAVELRLYSDPLEGPPSSAGLVGWFKAN
jgi:hypothetical protein